MANNITRRDLFKASGTTALGLGVASLISACGSGSGSDSAISGKTLKVGLMGPYSGDVAQYGLAVRNGAKLYVKQFNKKGGTKSGKKISLIVQDEKGDATEAVNVYQKMVEEDVVGIVGDVTSTPSIAVAQASVSDNIPLVTASATAADFIKYGKNAFRACYTDPYQGKLMADFAAQQGYKTVCTIYNSGGDYEKGVNDAFVKEAKKKGLTVATQESYSAGDVDFKAQLANIIAKKPDAVLSPNYYQDDGKIVTQARELGYTGVFLGADGWANIVGGDEDYASGKDLEGCFYDTSFVSANDDKRVQQFIKDYKAEYKSDPTNFCALGYDAAMILLTAINKVEKDGDAKDYEDYKQKVIDAIAKGKVEGVTGTIKYDGTGDPVKSTLIIGFKDGKEYIETTL
ncbi:ABC transporter substrate-binding protein [Parafannyhessea umbonata]|uniref:ABC transporter substrate-binding protein n=1 Tax=Parafannyhessea umbonata TaxID=604330 RepID=UPI0026EFCE02|nr:ABC transporter substrate-binding protein [Parafannyhessea umbonata]MDD7198794.1 ABC transporter substrate-binding protein [Parafannyhessea umbonata]MDY4418273.1 ABC transporter substrate-binding protein [Parafannyhessea umbonata]